MRNGFKFNGRHSSELGVTVKTKSRPLRPSSKDYIVDMPCRDGVYDFSFSNPRGRELYNNRIFVISVSVYADNLYTMQDKLSAVSQWLCGSGEMIFDDIPLILWRGKIIDEIVYMPERGGKKAVIEVSFRAEPFGYCIFDTCGPVLDVPLIRLDSDIPLEMEDYFTFTVSGRKDLYILNMGDRPVSPVISIDGNAGGILLSMNGKTLSFNASGSVTVDFEKQNVTNSNGSVNVSGEYFEFPEGGNILRVENSNTDTLTVKVSYRPMYMYNAYFDELEWGESNA